MWRRLQKAENDQCISFIKSINASFVIFGDPYKRYYKNFNFLMYLEKSCNYNKNNEFPVLQDYKSKGEKIDPIECV